MSTEVVRTASRTIPSAGDGSMRLGEELELPARLVVGEGVDDPVFRCRAIPRPARVFRARAGPRRGDDGGVEAGESRGLGPRTHPGRCFDQDRTAPKPFAGDREQRDGSLGGPRQVRPEVDGLLRLARHVDA